MIKRPGICATWTNLPLRILAHIGWHGVGQPGVQDNAWPVADAVHLEEHLERKLPRQLPLLNMLCVRRIAQSVFGVQRLHVAILFVPGCNCAHRDILRLLMGCQTLMVLVLRVQARHVARST